MHLEKRGWESFEDFEWRNICPSRNVFSEMAGKMKASYMLAVGNDFILIHFFEIIFLIKGFLSIVSITFTFPHLLIVFSNFYRLTKSVQPFESDLS